MTREGYIEKGWFLHSLKSNYRYDERSVKDAIKYTMEHPNWHDYKTDKDFPNEVILHTSEGTFSAEWDESAGMFMSGGVWVNESYETIIAWMPLPKYKKEQDYENNDLARLL